MKKIRHTAETRQADLQTTTLEVTMMWNLNWLWMILFFFQRHTIVMSLYDGEGDKQRTSAFNWSAILFRWEMESTRQSVRLVRRQFPVIQFYFFPLHSANIFQISWFHQTPMNLHSTNTNGTHECIFRLNVTVEYINVLWRLQFVCRQTIATQTLRFHWT